MKANKNTKILFLGSGPYAPDRREENDKFKYFSRYYSCIFLTPIFRVKNFDLKETLLEDNFTLIPFYYCKKPFIGNFVDSYRLIVKALSLYFIKNRKFNVVIATNPLRTGFCALFIAKLTKSKTIIEVNGNFESAFKYGRLGENKISITEKLKDFFGEVSNKIYIKKGG